jgi:hypothetical protein
MFLQLLHIPKIPMEAKGLSDTRLVRFQYVELVSQLQIEIVFQMSSRLGWVKIRLHFEDQLPM